ncbi:MAG: hypothetical protein WED15_06940 [Akkermansiaceae bacterium]
MNTTSLSHDPRDRLLLWSCLWGGGVIWMLHLLAVWTIAEFGCLTALARPGPLEISWVAWLILAVSVVLLSLTGLITWISWRRAGGGGGSDGERPGRFAARVGLVVNPLFGLIIIAETLPVFFYLRDCGTHL